MIHILAETGSTNADLAARLRVGDYVPEGDWLIADRQTRGRGRQGRTWYDGLGNFMGSTAVHRRFGDPDPASLSLMAGLAVQQTVSLHLGAGHQAALKWPNDLLVGGAKLAGILLESEGDSIIVGIGVNLVAVPDVPGRSVIAMSGLGASLTRDAFAIDLARTFDLELERWRGFGLPPLLGRWLTSAHPVGTPLEVGVTGETRLAGTFDGLADDGALQLRLADGSRRAIHAGEIHLANLEQDHPDAARD